MIITSHYLCPHNNLRPDYWDCFESKEDEKSLYALNQSVDLNMSVLEYI